MEVLENVESRQGDWFHPCYYEEAHKKYARMHLPVAPRCNVQCKFCNRLYDCVNETRPGVTSRMLSPEDAAILIDSVTEKIPSLAVAGIAGPGDPLANEETFEALRLVREHHPELALCLAT
ncbi:MAG: nitrogenase cofactor biosynthesis protein NifB, partial [Thermoplasmata archaeon]